MPPALASGGSFPGAVNWLLSVDASVHGNVNNSHNSIVGLYRHTVSKCMTTIFDKTNQIFLDIADCGIASGTGRACQSPETARRWVDGADPAYELGV